MSQHPTEIADRVAHADPIERQAAILGLAVSAAASRSRLGVINGCLFASVVVNLVLIGALVGAAVWLQLHVAP